ncbi:MAG: DUF6262 family protein, partial [Christensenellaceae bacterium]
KKKLPIGLAEKQELQRQETINKVLRACADIQNVGSKVTIAALVEYTGLSRSTFAKPHIRELLAEYGYASDDNAVTVTKRKKTKLDEIIVEKDRQIAELRIKNAELEKECQLLRGKIFLLTNIMNNKT